MRPPAPGSSPLSQAVLRCVGNAGVRSAEWRAVCHDSGLECKLVRVYGAEEMNLGGIAVRRRKGRSEIAIETSPDTQKLLCAALVAFGVLLPALQQPCPKALQW
eukprot:gene24264-biopygen103935